MTFKSKPSGCPKATYSVEDLFSPKTFKDKVYQKGDYPLEGLSQKLTHTMSKMTPEERSKCRKVAVSLLSQQTLSTLFDAEASLIALTPDKLPLNISLLSLIGWA
ncbi:hypothetical protein [Levilactobacillus namurensis]|uniref:Uncharacterized protein n=1 Tax=Levilactobacillus namurensis TaxID=380393 RepID=A0AAW8W959_9LACO|nr:hypothetical protein [Levilactobacillus namurensis]MDT7014908.1 hypothetical protein [Levilactobacillus namurensis]